MSLHTSVILITGNDVNPQTTLQVAISGVATFMGALINANIFGELAVLMAELSHKQEQFRHKIDHINTAVKNLGLPQELQLKIKDYVFSNQASHDN